MVPTTCSPALCSSSSLWSATSPKDRNAQLTHFKWRAFLSSVVKSHAIPLRATQDRSCPFVLRVLAVSTATVLHAATISVIRWVVGERDRSLQTCTAVCCCNCSVLLISLVHLLLCRMCKLNCVAGICTGKNTIYVGFSALLSSTWNTALWVGGAAVHCAKCWSLGVCPCFSSEQDHHHLCR